MPLVFKRLGYTLSPGERFAGDDELVDEVVEKYAKSEINRTEDILSKLNQMESKRKKSKKEDKKNLEKQEPTLAKKFLENLTLIGSLCCDENVDPKKLETHLKDLATIFVKQGLNKLSELKVEFNRPDDFYAEMIKSDEHMTKIIKALETRNKASTKKASSKTDKKTKKAIGKLSKKQYQLQQKNKFIKNVNVLRKKHKSGNIDKHIDKLISDNNTDKPRRGRPKGSKNKTSGGTKTKSDVKPDKKNIPTKRSHLHATKKKKNLTRTGKKSKNASSDTKKKLTKKVKKGKSGKSSGKNRKGLKK